MIVQSKNKLEPLGTIPLHTQIVWGHWTALRWCVGRGIDYVGSADQPVLPGASWVRDGAYGDRQKDGTYKEVTDGNIEATELPKYMTNMEYIFSSHLLHNRPDWRDVLRYWKDRVRPGGGGIYLHLTHTDILELSDSECPVRELSVDILTHHVKSIGMHCREALSGYDRYGNFYGWWERL